MAPSGPLGFVAAPEELLLSGHGFGELAVGVAAPAPRAVLGIISKPAEGEGRREVLVRCAKR